LNRAKCILKSTINFDGRINFLDRINFVGRINFVDRHFWRLRGSRRLLP
jgi:hypothetical protein